MSLRPFQLELVASVRAAYASGARSVLLQAPTGAGKTHTAAEVIRLAVVRGRKIVFAAHLDSLVTDTHARLRAAGVAAGFVQAGRPSEPSAPVQVASLATLHARGERPPADLLIVDEAHRAMAATVRGIIEAYPSAHVLGLSATPQRADGQPLGDVFERLVPGPTVAWLTREGFLVPADVLAPANDTGDALAMDPVAAYQAYASGSRAIVFASSVAHAEDVTARMTAAGVPAVCITGDTARSVREGVRPKLQSKEVLALVGVGVFIEGWDEPSVETVILARPFGVCGAFLQAIGRGLRPWTGKARCTVLDLRGAVLLHGLPDEERVWSLSGTAVRRLETMTALQRCASCFAVFRPRAECPRCGARAVPGDKLPRTLTRGERLERFSALDPAVRDARYLAKLERVARERLRLPAHRVAAWALSQFRKRFHRDPERSAA